MSIFETELQNAYAVASNKPADLDQYRAYIFGLFDTGSNQLLDVIFAKLQGPRGVHLETAISAASGLAGALLLRAAALPVDNLKPGAPVFSDAVNESGPELLSFMQALSQKMGIPPMSGWQNPPGADHQPLQPLVELVRELEPAFNKISDQLGIPVGLRPYMAAMGTVKIIKMGESALNPEISKAVALSALVAGSKTVPYQL